MVDVSNKPITYRRAVAAGYLSLCDDCAAALEAGDGPKGNPWTIAHIGAINGVKHAWELIPLAHPLTIDSIQIEHHWDSIQLFAWIKVEVSIYGRTGVEMEALAGVTAGLLVLYDMLKAVSHKMSISSARLLLKEGGRRGHIVQYWKECPWTNQD
jgi:cyclic pyranopterin phosphate synthase